MGRNFLNFDQAAGSLVIYLRHADCVSEDVISKPFINDIIMTVNLIFSENYEEATSIQITKRFVEYWNVDEDTIFNRALSNTRMTKARIEKVSDVLTSILGNQDEIRLHNSNNDMEIYVISSYNYLNGASCILQTANLKYFCKKVKTRSVIVIPSSIHECLLIPVREDTFIKINDIDTIIAEMNETVVSPEEVLSYSSLMWDLKSGWL